MADSSTENFDGYEAELRLVQADLGQKLDQISEQTGEPRKATIAQAQRALEEAQELVRLALASWLCAATDKHPDWPDAHGAQLSPSPAQNTSIPTPAQC